MTSKLATPVYARLLALHEDVQENEYLLEASKYIIGRLPGVCNVVINRNTVSRIHAEIERRGSHFILRNLGRNGTFVNGELISDEHILSDNERISLATVEPLLVFAEADSTDHPFEILHFDEETLTFYINDQSIDLNLSQFRLLQHLYRHKGQTCSRESCARVIWQDKYLPEFETDSLDKIIFSLRSRLRRIDPDTDFIKIQRGMGYILDF